jgi:steroid 5-alpha reductase family enzyme
MSWLQVIAAPVTGIVKAVIQSRQRKAELRHEIHAKKVEYVREGRIAEVEWNTKAKATSGWIDDYLTIVLSLPLILSFFPKLVPHIEAGFMALEQTPVWYRAAIAVMISAGFGYKKFADWQMSKHYTLPDPITKIGDGK